MGNNKKQIICFISILFLWLFCSQEIHSFDRLLHNAVFIRYIIYFFWIAAVGFIGYIAWSKLPQQWAKKAWVRLYAIVFLILLLLGALDLLFFHFNKSQRNYIQSFRLFFQSPVPFVVFSFLIRMSGGKAIG